MLCARLILLVGVVFLVKAVSSSDSFDGELTIDDFEEILLDNLGEPMVSELSRERRDADEEVTSPSPVRDHTSSSEAQQCPPCPERQTDSHTHPCAGLSKHECHRKMAPVPYNGPPCDLRPLFRMPMEYNITARKECFIRWEKPAFEAKGVNLSREGLRLMGGRGLMIHKGCDEQCMFLETSLLVEDGDSFTLSKEGVMALLKQDEDSQEILDNFEEHINKCIEESAELVHPKQSCKSGADEFLACVRFSVENSCPGAKWKSSKSCDEAEDARDKRRNCRREMRHKFTSQMQRRMKMKHLHQKD